MIDTPDPGHHQAEIGSDGTHEPDSVLQHARSADKKWHKVTSAKLADLARVQPPNMSAYQTKKRIMPVAVAVRLARELLGHRKPGELLNFAKKLRQLSDPTGSTEWPKDLSVLPLEDRMVLGVPIRVAFVTSEPFIFPGEPSGFAFEVYELVKNLLDVTHIPIHATFGDLSSLFQHHEVDLVVSAMLPTFRRQRFMDFTTPLPFLSISLAGLVTKDMDLSTEDLLHWTVAARKFFNSRDNSFKNEGRILLAKGEVGDEFCQAFLGGINMNSQVVTVEHLKPDLLYETMVKMDQPVLLLADRSTCEAVYQLDKGTGKLDRLRSRLDKKEEETFGELASYPIAFGVPKDDPEWKLLINQALDALKNEGICKLVGIYEKYYYGDRGFKLKDFISPVDRLVNQRQRKYFERLLPQTESHFGQRSRLCAECQTPLTAELEAGSPSTIQAQPTSTKGV